MVELIIQSRILFWVSRKGVKGSWSYWPGSADNDGPWSPSWDRLREGGEQISGDLSGLKEDHSGKPWTGVRDLGWRMSLMAGELGQPLCQSHQHLKDIPNKHALSKSGMCLPCKWSCRVRLQFHPTSKEIALFNPPTLCISIDWGRQRLRHFYCWPSSQPSQFSSWTTLQASVW